MLGLGWSGRRSASEGRTKENLWSNTGEFGVQPIPNAMLEQNLPENQKYPLMHEAAGGVDEQTH